MVVLDTANARLGVSVLAVALMLSVSPAALAQQGASAATDASNDQASSSASDNQIVVTGSRIAREGFDAPSPVTVVGQQQIQGLGLVNVGDVVAQLPAVRASLSPTNAGFGNFNVGAQVANLRGLSTLAANRTLVLVNGRRFVPTSREGSVDLNMIPTLLVDRMEVSTGGASAVYGSDAVAGVVNVLLRTDMEGVRTQFDYGISEQGDGQQFHAAIAGGTSFLDGRLRVVAGGEYDRRDGIGTCFTRDWCTTAGIVQNATAIPRYQIFEEGVGFLATQGGALPLFGNPTLAGSPFANVQFAPDGSIIPYVPGTVRGSTNQQGGTISSPYETTQILVPTRRYSLYGHAEYDFSDDLTGFAEASFGEVEGTNVGAATWDNPVRDASRPTYYLIRRDNPFIPKALADHMAANPSIPGLNLYRLGNDLGLSTGNSSGQTWRIATGLKGNVLDGRLRWDVYYSHGRTNQTQEVSGTRLQSRYYRAVDAVMDNETVITPQTGIAVCRDTLSPDPAVRAAAVGCEPLNLFGINQFSAAAKQYAYGTPQPESVKIRQDAAGLNFAGDVVELPAGSLAMAAGAEWRKESANVKHNEFSEALDYYQNFGRSYAGKVEVVEGYLEASVPVLRDSAVGSFILDGAVRRTRYENTSNMTGESRTINATTWKLSGVYDPVEWLSLRVTRSRDLRAPSFNELYAASGSSFAGYINRRLPGNPTQFPFSAGGGNIALSAETANTLTVGAVFQPKGGLLDRLRLSVDYYDIVLNGAIGSLGGSNIADRCFNNDELCDLLDFDSAGNLVRVRNVNLNLDQLVSRGLDIEVDYVLPLGPGQLRARVLANHAIEQSTTTSITTFDRTGVTGPGGNGVPDWTVNATLSYASGPALITLQTRFISAGAYSNERIGPDDSRYQEAIASCSTVPVGPLCANTINDNTIPSAAYVNLSGSYDIIDRADGMKVQLFGSINNLLNKEPPLAPDNSYPTNPVYFDQIGRFYRVGVRVNF